jgi:hypothetical protein
MCRGWEVFMLTDEVWAEAAAELADVPDVMLCIGCIEHRLGRRLTPDDFDWTLTINSPSSIDSDRLADRKGRTA